MAQVGKIDDFRPDVEPWTAYIERLEQYLEANDVDEEKHVAVLLSVMGAKAYGLLRNLVQPGKPKDKTFGEIVDILKEHYEPKPILVAERFRFNRCNQKTSQTVAQYVAELKQQAANCDFGASLDSALRDRFVSGIKNEACQRRLLSEDRLTFAKAFEIALNMETADRDTRQLRGAEGEWSSEASVHKERTGPDDGLLGGPRESDLIKRVAVDGPEVKPSGSRYSKWVQLVHNQGHQQNQEEISIRTRTRNKPPSEPEETSIRTREKVNQNQNQDRMIWGTEIGLIQGRFCSWIQSSSGCFLFQVLVTVPLTLLQRGLLHFHPPLPERKLKAIHSLGAGIIEKIALQFPTRFWDSKIQGADYFGHIPPAPEKRGLFSVFYDLDPQGKQAVLMSVISGDAVPAVCELEDQEVVGECLKVLRELFPEQDVPDPVNYFVTHWSKDRWSQMSYSFVKTGGSGEAYDVLAEDVQGKLFFAGEATNRHFPQTVTGAYLSGVREASKMAAV
ncbi:uncharacterized protein ACNS7B_017795 isoform 3-T5 [Menidia menidia]